VHVILFAAAVTPSAFAGKVVATTDRDLFAVGTMAQESAGTAVASADVNADGMADLLVGAPGAQDAFGVAVGKVYILLGPRHVEQQGDRKVVPPAR